MAESIVGKLVVQLDFDGAEFERGITRAKRELSSYGKAVQTSTQWAKDSNYAMEASTVALSNMQNHYKALEATKRQTIQTMQKEAEANGKNSAKYAQYQRELNNYTNEQYRLMKQYTEMQRQTAIANAGFTKIGEKLNRIATGVKSFGQGMVEVGDSLTQVGVLATAGGALFVKQAMDFEDGLVSVQKTTNATSEEMKVLEKDIRQLANTMPIAHGELTNLASIAGQLGVKQQDLAHFTKTMAMMGTATNLSASEASEAIARFTNVTGTGIENIDRIGSAIVHLGNNFATSEREIVDMSMNLVGTMSSLGATEAEILAVATAMSSLGITAERGGSSISKFFVDMASSVNEGGDALIGFTRITGMTEEAFTNLFKTDPTQAFKAFIDGLAEIERQGGSVVQALDDFGIKEIRLRDTLLRLAQGHKVLGSALGESNQAFNEGTALMQEYELMASSTSSQWEIAKNQFRDVAISIGQELLPVILDLLGQSDGVIDMAKGFADWFGNLDDGMKEFIVKAGVLAPILGTLLSTGGKLLTGGANIISVIGRIAKSLGILEGAFKLLGMTDIAGNAISIGTAFSGLINPVTLAGVAIAGVGTAVYLATDDMRKMYARMNEFPDITGVTERQATSLRSMADEVAGINTQLDLLDDGYVNFDTLKENVSGLATEIGKLNDEKIQNLKENFKKLPESVQEALRESLEKTISNIEEQTSRVNDVLQRINEIEQKGMDENGLLRENYVTEMKGLNDELLTYYSISLAENAEQQKEIYSALTMDFKSMTEEQFWSDGAQKQWQLRADNIKKLYDSEKTLYQEQQQVLYDMMKNGTISYEQYYAQLETTRKAHNSRISAINKEAFKHDVEDTFRTFQQMDENITRQNKDFLENIRELAMNEYGYTWAEAQAIMNEVDLTKPIEDMALAMKDASPEVKSAVNKWNEAFNEFGKDLNVDNIEEFIEFAKEAGLTWDDLELIEKEANIDSNTQEIIDQIKATYSEWDLLSLEEKQAKIQTEGKEEFEQLLKDLGVTWEEIEPRVKELTVDGRPAMDALWIALSETDNWNNLTVDQKMLLVENSIANEKLREALGGLEEWQKIELIEKFAQIRTNAPETQVEFTNLLVEWGLIPSADTKVFTTETNAEGTQETIGTLASYWLLSLIGSFLPSANFETETNAEETQGQVSALSEEMTVTRANMGKGAKATMTTNSSQTVTALGGVGRTMNNTRTNMGRGASATLRAYDRATSVMRYVSNQLWALNGRTATTYIDTVHRTFGRRAYSGTNRHIGGALVLGDGGRREPFLTPDGRFGVSPSTDTVYDLPYGTKVWSSVNRFKQEASDSPLLAQYIKQLPHFATGTKHSFLDELQTIKLPVRLDDFGKTQNPTASGDTLVFNIDLSVVGNSLSPQQADRIIEPLIKSAERYTNKRRTKVTIGGG